MSNYGSRKLTESSVTSNKVVGKDNIAKTTFRSFKRGDSTNMINSQMTQPMSFNEDGVPDIDFNEHKNLFQKQNLAISQVTDLHLQNKIPASNFDITRINGNYDNRQMSKQTTINNPDLTNYQNANYSKQQTQIENSNSGKKSAVQSEYGRSNTIQASNFNDQNTNFSRQQTLFSRQQTLADSPNMEQRLVDQNEYRKSNTIQTQNLNENSVYRQSETNADNLSITPVSKKTISVMKRSDKGMGVSGTGVNPKVRDFNDFSPDFGVPQQLQMNQNNNEFVMKNITSPSERESDDINLIESYIPNEIEDNGQKNADEEDDDQEGEEDEKPSPRRVITGEEFTEHVYSRFEQLEEKKKRKVANLRKTLAEQYERENKHEPQINKNSKYLQKNHVPLQDRMGTFMEEKSTKLQQLKRKLDAEKQKNQEEECTFAPKINKKSQHLKKNKTGDEEKETAENLQDKAIDDLLKWGQHRDAKLENKKLIENSGVSDAFKFKPQISEKSKQIVYENLHIKDKGVHKRLYNGGKTKEKLVNPEVYSYKPSINKKSRQIAEKNKKDKSNIKIAPIDEENVTKPIENSPDNMEAKFDQILNEAFDKVSHKILRAQTPRSIGSTSQTKFGLDNNVPNSNDLLTIDFKPRDGENLGFLNFQSDQIINQSPPKSMLSNRSSKSPQPREPLCNKMTKNDSNKNSKSPRKSQTNANVESKSSLRRKSELTPRSKNLEKARSERTLNQNVSQKKLTSATKIELGKTPEKKSNLKNSSSKRNISSNQPKVSERTLTKRESKKDIKPFNTNGDNRDSKSSKSSTQIGFKMNTRKSSDNLQASPRGVTIKDDPKKVEITNELKLKAIRFQRGMASSNLHNGNSESKEQVTGSNLNRSPKKESDDLKQNLYEKIMNKYNSPDKEYDEDLVATYNFDEGKKVIQPMMSREIEKPKRGYVLPAEEFYRNKQDNIIRVGDNYNDDENMEQVIYDEQGREKGSLDYMKKLNSDYYYNPTIPEVEQNMVNTYAGEFKQSTLQLLRNKYNQERQQKSENDSKKIYSPEPEYQNEYDHQPMLAPTENKRTRNYGSPPKAKNSSTKNSPEPKNVKKTPKSELKMNSHVDKNSSAKQKNTVKSNIKRKSSYESDEEIEIIMQDEQEISDNDGSFEYVDEEDEIRPGMYNELNYNNRTDFSNNKNVNNYKNSSPDSENRIKNYGKITLSNGAKDKKPPNNTKTLVSELNDLVGDVERELINSGNYIEPGQSNADIEDVEIEDNYLQNGFGSNQYYSNKNYDNESQEIFYYDDENIEAEHPYQNFDMQNYYNQRNPKVKNVNIGELLDDISINHRAYNKK